MCKECYDKRGRTVPGEITWGSKSEPAAATVIVGQSALRTPQIPQRPSIEQMLAELGNVTGGVLWTRQKSKT